MLALTVFISALAAPAATAPPASVCGLARTHVGQAPASARLVAWGRFLHGDSRTLAWLDAKSNVFVFDGISRRASQVAHVDVPTAAWTWDDIDRDTRDDLVVGGPAWLESPGPGGAQTWEVRTQGKSGLRAVNVVDLDADGKPDFVAASLDGALTVWKQVRKQQWDTHAIAPQAQSGWASADMNSDGRSDLVFADAWFETPADLINGEWKQHALPLPSADKDAAVLAIDVNADKWIDVVVAAPQAEGHATVVWNEAPQMPNGTWKRHVVFVSPTNARLQVLSYATTTGTRLIIADEQGHLTQVLLTSAGGLRSECILSRRFRGELYNVAGAADEASSFIATETSGQGQLQVVRWQMPAVTLTPDQTPAPQPKTKP